MRHALSATIALALVWTTAGDEPVIKVPVMWQRLIQADTVVIGLVTAIEDKPIESVPTPAAKEKVLYKIAQVKVQEAILGAKGKETLRVGFVKDKELKVDQEACFILAPHHAQPFYVYREAEADVCATGHRWFEYRMKILRQCARCLEKPLEALKSQDTQDRLLTAAILISRYRDSALGPKTEPIDAEESKLLLRALRDADWGKEDKALKLSPQPLFALLGLTAKDGWNPPKDPVGARLAAENWLIDNHNKYRILRFVPEKK